MKRLGLVLAIAVIASAALIVTATRLNRDASAQTTAAPIFLAEVASWQTSKTDPTNWEWQAFEDGSLRVIFSLDPAACPQIQAPAGVIGAYINDQAVIGAIQDSTDAVTMCEAQFTRVNG